MINTVRKSLNKQNGTLLFAGARDISVDIPSMLIRFGYNVKKVVLYKTQQTKTLEKKIIGYIDTGLATWVVLLSHKGACAFINLASNTFNKKTLKNLKIACLSKSIASLVNNSGLNAVYPEKPNIKLLPELIISTKEI